MTAKQTGVSQAAAKPRQQRTAAEQKKIEEAIEKEDTTDAKAKVTTGSPAEGEVLPKAEPEAVGKPGDEAQPAKDDNPTPSGEERPDNDPAKEGEAKFDVPPATAGPNETVPEGSVEVTRKAQEGEPSDPGGNVTTARKTGKARAPKEDPLAKIADFSKLPVAVSVGQVTAVVEEYAGNPVLALSLKGWVGDAPLKIRAADVGEIEQALSELRKELSA